MSDSTRQTSFGRIPSTWRIKKVRDVGDVQLGRQRSPAMDQGPNMVPYLRVANVFDGYFDYGDVKRMQFSPAEQQRYAVRSGDILLNEGQSLELVGRSALYEGSDNAYCFQNTLIRFRPLRSLVFSPFARAVFKRWLDTGHFTKIAKQTTSIAHLGADRFANLDFPHPPLPEQRKIAEVLDTVDEAIRKTEQIIAKLEQVKQGLLHDLLTRGIDDNGELRDPDRHPEQFKDSPLGRLPKEWEVVTLGDVLSDIYRYPTYYGIDYVEEGVLELRGELLNPDGTVCPDLNAYRRVSQSTAARFPRVRLASDDFVMSVRGTLGKIARVPPWLAGGVITANLIKFSLKRSRALPHWMAHCLLAPPFQDALDQASSATTIKTIQVPALLEIRISLPSLAEQERTCMALNTLDARLAKERAEIAKLRLVKNGLMEDLLTGRVRVTPLLQEAAE